MIESLLIFNILTLAIIGGLGYFYIQSLHLENKERLETAVNFYEKIISQIQEEKQHLYNCFLDKQGKPPLGTDLKAEREQRIEQEKKRKEQNQGLVFPNGNSPTKQAQYEALQEDAKKRGLV